MAYPKFFKVIVNPRDNKLSIPTEFMRRHGRNLPDRVSLSAPKGAAREVQLLHSDGDTWLHKGWNEFKEYYSIGFGHLLLFIYDRNSNFDVLIYGMNGVEIDYPNDKVNRTCDQVPQTTDIGRESDEPVLLVKEISTNKKSIRECKRGPGRQYETTICRESSLAYQKAKSSKFCNPHCISLMQPYYVHQFSLSIPISFMRAHLPKNKKMVKLRNLNGKMWSVKCHSSKLSAGWKEFVVDNALKVGDVCVFEVIKGNELVWDVTIFRS